MCHVSISVWQEAQRINCRWNSNYATGYTTFGTMLNARQWQDTLRPIHSPVQRIKVGEGFFLREGGGGDKPAGGVKMPINPLNAELNPICHLTALVGAHHILHVSTIRTDLHLAPRLGMSAASLISPHAFKACAGTGLPFNGARDWNMYRSSTKFVQR
jgi:hypothetical protein